MRRFASRVRAGAFVGGLANGAAVGAVTFAAVLLALRILEIPVPLAWWWALPVVLPAFAWGTWRALHVGFGRRLSAQHLDRRLGLQGLLLSACEVDTGAWQAPLRKRLNRAAEVRPRARSRRLLRHALVGLLLLAAVALLPQPTGELSRHDPLGAEVLEELERKLDALAETEAVEVETAEELRRRIGEIKEGAKRDGVLSWSDVDTLEDRLEHERDLKAGTLAKAMQDLASFAAGLRDEKTGSAENAGDATQAALDAAKAMQAAMDAGLLSDLPKDLLEKMGLSQDGSAIDPSALSTDPELLAQLAAALAQAAGDELFELAGLDGLDGFDGLEGLDLADLDEMLEAALGEFVEGEPCELCDGSDEDCPG